jgi:hypothetical protein
MENENENEIKNIAPVVVEVDEKPKKRGRPRKEEGKHSKDAEECKAYQKQYYDKNKEKLLNDMKEKIMCPLCEHQVSRCNLLTHQKSTKCKAHAYSVTGHKLEKLVEEFYKLKRQPITPHIKFRLEQILYETRTL